MRSVSTMKATTARPVNAPMTSDSPRKTWLSRCRSPSMRSESGTSHQLLLAVCMGSFIFWEVPPLQNSPLDSLS